MKTYFLILRLSVLHRSKQSIPANMLSSAQQLNFRVNEAGYLNALKKGLGLDKSTQVQEYNYDHDRDNSSSNSDDEIQTRSKTTRKIARRNERNTRKQQQQQHTVAAPVQQSESPIVEKKQKKNLTKRQQVLQRYADEEAAAGAASVLASIADAAVTRSQVRNRNTVIWTERDRAAASRAAEIAVEVAAQAAEATQGKKKKEQPAPYWTRFHEKNRSSVRFHKEMNHMIYNDV